MEALTECPIFGIRIINLNHHNMYLTATAFHMTTNNLPRKIVYPCSGWYTSVQYGIPLLLVYQLHDASLSIIYSDFISSGMYPGYQF